jgi:hypothetical protein
MNNRMLCFDPKELTFWLESSADGRKSRILSASGILDKQRHYQLDFAIIPDEARSDRWSDMSIPPLFVHLINDHGDKGLLIFLYFNDVSEKQRIQICFSDAQP